MTSELASPASASAGASPDWRRQAGFLGAVLAIAAAVIAAGLRFAPQVSAYSGLAPWVFVGLLGFVLVLAGACVLLAVTLSGPVPTAGDRAERVPGYPGARVEYPQPPPPPWNPNAPAVSPLAGQAATDVAPTGQAPTGQAPAGQVPAGHASGGQAPRAPATPGRGLTVLGGLLGVVGLAFAALAVLLAVALPTPTESITVQFTDLYGRVQLEYCPDLPGSFAGTASHSDLVGSATILPVRVSAAVCGNPDYTDGVWIYLNRDAVTVSDLP